MALKSSTLAAKMETGKVDNVGDRVFTAIHTYKHISTCGPDGGGQVVSVLAFWSDDKFSLNCILKNEISKKRPGMARLKTY